jgi:hypothetical protein
MLSKIGYLNKFTPQEIYEEFKVEDVLVCYNKVNSDPLDNEMPYCVDNLLFNHGIAHKQIIEDFQFFSHLEENEYNQSYASPLEEGSQ